MPSVGDARERYSRSARHTRVAVGVVALVAFGPLVWVAHLTVSYWLVPVACGHRNHASLYLVTAAAIAGGVAAVWIGYRRVRHEGGRRGLLETVGWDEASGSEDGRHLLLSLGLLLGGFFLLIVMVAGLAPLLVDACA